MNLLSVIKPHITHFSEELRLNGTNEQEVVVAGVIKRIIEPDIYYDQQLYIIFIDDGVGELQLYYPSALIDPNNPLTLGQIYSFNGYLNVLSYKRFNKVSRNISLFAFKYISIDPSGESSDIKQKN